MERQEILDSLNGTIAVLKGWKPVDGKYFLWRTPDGKLRSKTPNWAGDMTTAMQLMTEMKDAGINVGLMHNPLNGAMSVKGWTAYCRSTFDKELVHSWKYYHFEYSDEDPEIAVCKLYISWKDWMMLNHPPDEVQQEINQP